MNGPTPARLFVLAFFAGCLVFSAASAQLSTWSIDGGAPAVLFVTPGGNGNTLAEVGQTLRVTWIDDGGFPIGGVAAEDMGATLRGDGTMCSDFVADGPSNANGEAVYSGGFAGGGWSQDGLDMWCTPGDLTISFLLEDVPIWFNSPDIDGTRRVDLADVALFAQDFTGAYHFRSDFQYDGVLDLADVGRMALHLGESCP